ncbi:MAG: acetyl-CoA carboxylase carboxyltransferase subunit alpha [Deltaproteobacteria bacterium]|nr:acetyl-CoA carboxylase carboxyltransferase subunit alpha [Deltaproteobacteria bacterium]
MDTPVQNSAVKKRRYLEFERPLEELDQQIDRLKNLKVQGAVDVSSEIKTLEKKSEDLLTHIFANLNPYQIVQLSRHPDRPSCLDYLSMIFDEFIELHGDRNFMEDASIVGAMAKLQGQTVMVIGHQKGKSTQENQIRNFGMPRPEGYRKALRLMKLAERWKLPIITFIDTPGAYPGIDAEERGQAQAIAENILTMTDLSVPIISVILGEGGSGGALAIAVSDRMLMLEFSIYSVISPEGCAAITWKDGSFASKAAEELQVTSKDIVKAKVADRAIQEPLGGAHRDPLLMANRLKEALIKELQSLKALKSEDLISKRYDRYRHLGAFEGAASSP